MFWLDLREFKRRLRNDDVAYTCVFRNLLLEQTK